MMRLFKKPDLGFLPWVGNGVIGMFAVFLIGAIVIGLAGITVTIIGSTLLGWTGSIWPIMAGIVVVEVVEMVKASR